MLQLWGYLCAPQVGWASGESLDLCSWLLFRGGSLWLALALPAVLQHRVALKGEWEPGQATAATVSVSYPGC